MSVPYVPYQILSAAELNASIDELGVAVAGVVASVAAVAASVAAEPAARSAAVAAETAARVAADVAAVTALRPLNVYNYGVVGNGDPSDTPRVQALIDQLEAAGGGVLYFPARTTPVTINQTLTIKHPGVVLVGDSLDINHDFTPSWTTMVNTAPVSALLWGGAAGGTMIQVAPVANADNGGGIGGNGVQGMVLFAGQYPFSTVAAYGVVVAGAKGGRYNLFGVEFSGAALFFSTLNRGQPTWENSSQFNIIEYLGSRNVSTAGGALRMDGATGQGNAYNNVFHLIDVLHTNGNALDLGSCDNNIFLMTRIQRAAGTGIGVYLRSADQIDMMARANVFHLLSPGAGGVYSEASHTYPAYENKILFYNPDENGAPQTPVIGSGSTLYWGSTKRSGSCTFQAAMSGSQTIPTGVWTKVLFNTAIIDEATWYDTTNCVWKPRYPGTFMLTASVSFTVAAASGSVQMRMLQNAGGSAAFRTARTTRATGTDALSINAMFGLNGTTDFVEVDVFQDSGSDATINVSSDQGYFQGARIG